MAQDEEFLAVGRDPDPQQSAQRRDGLRVQGARAARNIWSAGAARLRERLADLNAIQLRMHQPPDGRSGPRALVDSGGRAGDRRGARALARPHRAARSRARRRADQRGGHPHLPRRHPGALARASRRSWARRARCASIPPGTMVLLDGQRGTIVLDPTRDELEDAKTQLSRRHRLELQLEAVVERAGGDPVRPGDHPAWATWTCPTRSRRRSGMGAQGVGLLRTEFLLTGRAALPTEDEQADYFRRVATAFRGAHGRDPLLRPRRRQVPGRVHGAGGSQPVPRLALDPRVPRRARGLPAADPRDPSGGGGPRHPAHAAAGHPGGGGGADPRDHAGGSASGFGRRACRRRRRCRSAS